MMNNQHIWQIKYQASENMEIYVGNFLQREPLCGEEQNLHYEDEK